MKKLSSFTKMSSYKNLIFTKHALARLKKRTVSPDSIYQAVNFPDKKIKKAENYKFIKKVRDRNVQVIAQFKAKEQKWLIISVWVRGEDDQNSLVWQLLSLPFKLAWFLIAKIAKIILSYNKNSVRHKR